MHSHDRTLLAKLGFADPDKRDRRHDLACQYLTQPEQHEKLIRLIGNDKPVPLSRKPQMEAAITKGSGQYGTTIGFVDVVLPIEDDRDSKQLLLGEVKIHVCGVGEILRQINLYREYECCFTNHHWPPGFPWFVATAFALNQGDVAALANANILHVRLGARFDDFMKEHQAQQAADSVEL